MRARYAIFWTTSAITAVLLLWVLYEFLYGFGQNFPVIDVPGLVVAAAIWVVGWICRVAL